MSRSTLVKMTHCWKSHNDAHLLQIGFNVEGILIDADGNVEGDIEYDPREDPLDLESARVTVNLTKFTGNTKNKLY